MKFFKTKSGKFQGTKYDEIYHRFVGITREDSLFYVQIKEDRKTDQKWLLSIFGIEN